VASLLLVLAILPIFAALTASLLAMEESVVVTIATGLLQDRVEVLKAAGYDLVPLGTQVLESYEGRPFDIHQEVTHVEGMTDGEGMSLVKRVVLTIYRHPYGEGDRPLARWEFLLYADGI